MAPRRSPRLRGGSGPSVSSSSSSRDQSSPPTSPHTSESPRDPSSDSDFEPTLSRQKRGRPQGSTQGQQIPKRSRHPSKNGKSLEDNSLFQAILSRKAAVETLVDEWLELYKRDQESGLLELLNFTVQACGCRGVVTPEMFRELQNSQIIQQLTEKFQEDSSEYPLCRSGRPWRRFRAGLAELVALLAHKGRLSALHDGVLLPTWAAFLTGLCDSQVRAFRHTGTLAAMKLMSSLVLVALELSGHQETAQRQLEQERGRDLGRRSTEKLETLLEKHRELLEQQQELEAMMNVLFKGVFVHRYRDVVPDIRAICMEELGMWIRTCPESFLTDSYLKYIGWTLHDKHWEVRLCCVRALQGLYGEPQNAPRLELFTDRFRPRLVAMVQDKELQVAVEVVKLLTLMAQNVAEFLSEEDCQGVYPAVFVASRALGSAAGTFLFHRLLDPQKHGNGARDNQTFFRLLLTFFLESHIHEHAAYLVDSLWDCAGERLRDWDTATGMLLETSLQDRQEKALVEVLTCSALQCARGQPPVGRAAPRKVSSRERKEQEEEKSRLSRSFIPVLPQLLEKFSADAHPVASLLTVLRHLELGLLCSARMERVLCQVLCQVREVFGKHSERGVLDAASRALYALCDPELPLHARGDVTRGLLGDSLADRCHLQVTELLQAVAPDEEDIYGLAATLRRISALFNAHDLTPWQLFGPCSQLLQHALDTGEVPAQVTAPALSCLFFHVLWELSRLHPPDVAQDQLHALRSRALCLCQLCQSCLSEPELELQEQAFVVLCDLLVVLGPRLPHSGRESLFPLVLPLDESLQAQLGSFLMDRVFVSPGEGQPNPNPMGMFLSPGESQSELEAVESQLQALHRRRELLSGFSKLVLLQVLPPRAASDIFKHYVKFYEDFGDMLKETLRRLRDMDLLEWARTLLLSLKQLQTELLLQEGPPLRGSQEFQGIRDLARRFSLFFGPHRAQTRPVLLALHREGIQFAFQEPPQPQFEEGSPLNLPFLEVLSEFSPRLQPPDRALILSFLEQTLREWGGVSGGLPAWPPLLTYRHSLSPPSGGETPPKPPRTKRPRLEAPSEPPSSSPWLPCPPLTSTALRPPPKNRGRPPSPPSLQSLTLMEEGRDEEEEEEGSNGDPPDQPGDPPKDLFDYALNSQDF